MNKMDGCDRCDGGMIDTDVMWRVTGQTGMAPEAIFVYTCLTCGHKWNE